MKVMIRLLSMLTLALCLAACSDDIEKEFRPSGSIEEEEGTLVSVFTLKVETAGNEENVEGTRNVTFHISAPARDIDLTFSGSLSPELTLGPLGKRILLNCRLRLDDVSIPDGEYYLVITGDNLPDYGAFKIKVLDRTITEIGRSTYHYNFLKGEGTQENPYQIADVSQFSSFMNDLYHDPDHGLGLYFIQTGDISLLWDNSDGVVGVTTFQGCYDGNGHSITSMEWQKVSHKYPDCSDTNIGLFRTLCNATVKNLTITEAKFVDIARNGGMLAGCAFGCNTLENLHIQGNISGKGEYIGGVVGFVQGTMNVSGVTVEKGSEVWGHGSNTGGFFGYFEPSGDSSVKGIECRATVMGADNVGGLCGMGRSTRSVTVEDVKFDGYVNGTVNVGGLFGYLESLTVHNVQVGCSDYVVVRGLENVGGIAGRMTNATLSDTQAFDFAKGKDGVLVIPAPGRFKSSCHADVYADKVVGGLAGYALNSKLLHISSSAGVESAGERVGGLVGYMEDTNNESRFEDCTFTGTLVSPSSNCVGGIVGYFSSTDGGLFLDCVNYSSISGANCTAGICGYLLKDHNNNSGARNLLDLTWAVNAGNVSGANNVGGIVGEAYFPTSNHNHYDKMDYEIEMAYCMNAAQVIAAGGDSEQGLGGIVGRTGVVTYIYRCANHGLVEAHGKLHAVGGIIGRIGRDSSAFDGVYYNTLVTECVNTGTVNSTNRDPRLGGIGGYGEESAGTENGITWSRNSGHILADQKDDTGGILGCTDTSTVVKGNFNCGKVDHGNAILGTHKSLTGGLISLNYYLEGTGGTWPSSGTTGLSKSKYTEKGYYHGWDFDKVWEMTSDGPNLRYNYWRDPASASIE